jgi:hypothetical protein
LRQELETSGGCVQMKCLAGEDKLKIGISKKVGS